MEKVSRFWRFVKSKDEALDWREECYGKRLDCLTVEKTAAVWKIRCQVHPSHQLSELAYHEVWELMESLGPVGGSLGSNPLENPSEFEIDLPKEEPLEPFLEEIRELLRRDRSSQRMTERMKSRAPFEGWAIALDSTGLWEGHGPDDRLYVQEIEGAPRRCIALKHLHLPLVDLPISQFRILAPQDC